MMYKNENDNRYRVRFMRATEELMGTLTVKEFISYLEENAELEDEVREYLDGRVVSCKAYELKEENSNLRKEFLVTEDGRVFYWLSLLQKIELVDREEKEEVQDMQERDFREVKDTVQAVVRELREQDANWGWRAVVTKKEVKIFWEYLQYIGTKEDHFTVRMGTQDEGNTANDFVTGRNERDEYISGAIIGADSWADGDFSKCVARCIRGIASRAHSTY